MLLTRITLFSFIVPLLTGIVLFKTLDKTFRYFFLLTCIGALSDSILFIFYLLKITQIPVLNSYVIIESILLPLLFNTLNPFKQKKSWLYFTYSLLAIVFICSYFYTSNFTTFNKYARCAESLIIIMYSGKFLINESNNTSLPLFKNSAFLLVSILLTYFCISLALFSISDYILVDHPTQLAKLWHIQSWLNLFCNLAFSYCYWCNSQTKN